MATDGLDEGAGGLSLSSMVKEIQGLKDKFKREDGESRALHCFRWVTFTAQLRPLPTWKNRPYFKNVAPFLTPRWSLRHQGSAPS